MPSVPIEGGCQLRCGALPRRRRAGHDRAVPCTMCRRANAAPAVAWAMYEEAQAVFPATRPTIHESSPGARRGFCASCGTQVRFSADYIPGLVDITIGSLDQPQQVPPALHYWDAERLPWVQRADDLPRHAGFPPAG